MSIDSEPPNNIVFILPGDKEFHPEIVCSADGCSVIFTGGNGRSVIFTGGKERPVEVVAGVTVTPVLRRFASVGVGVADIDVAGNVVADVKVGDTEGADVDAGDDGVNMTRTARRVAANVIVDDDSPFSLIFFLLPNPSVNEDFTLRLTAAAAFTAVPLRLSASDENISGLIAQWTAWIFSESKSNPAIARGREECEACNNNYMPYILPAMGR
jgi:hypothetical protein